MKTLKLALSGSFVLLSFLAFGQNLVVNPSFEEGAKCDGETAETSIPTDWLPLAGSPMFLNTKCQLAPDQKTFVQGMKLPNAYMGNVYAGMGIEEEGEYLRGKFTKPLEKSMRYWVKLRVRLPIRFCSTPIDEVGVVITDSTFAVTEDYVSIDMPSLKLKSNDQSPIKDQYQWQEISTIYEAKGGETFIMIGNFKDNNVSNFKNRITEQEAKPEEERKKLCTYIYIDVVTVEEYKEITLKNYSPGADLKKGDRLLLKDVEFETSLDKLKAESFPSLDALAKQLVDKATLRLEVSGHTDNTGDESTNRLFSKMRAEAVVNYLVGKGVKATQLVVEGKGSSMNIAQNTSEANKKKNRRTEIKVMEE